VFDSRLDFSSSVCVQTCSRAHPGSRTLHTWRLSSRIKAHLRLDADHSPLPHLVPISGTNRGFTSSHSKHLHGVQSDSLLYCRGHVTICLSSLLRIVVVSAMLHVFRNVLRSSSLKFLNVFRIRYVLVAS
jgi:hypothetical protein